MNRKNTFIISLRQLVDVRDKNILTLHETMLGTRKVGISKQVSLRFQLQPMSRHAIERKNLFKMMIDSHELSDEFTSNGSSQKTLILIILIIKITAITARTIFFLKNFSVY